MIRLHAPIDLGHHHTGWPWVQRHLRSLETPDGLPLDDQVEFSYRAGKKTVAPVWDRPWGAVFHQPPDVPSWFPGYKACPAVWMKRPEWRQSVGALRVPVALCPSLADWLEPRLEHPVVRLLHPAAPPRWRFDPAAFAARPTVVQIGHHLRNVAAIHQLQPVAGIEFVEVRLQGAVADKRRRAVEDHWDEEGGRTRHPGVTVRPPADDEGYERMLSQCVVFLELFAAAAVNVVIECMVRDTPLVVNRLPAVEDYLGKDYPLFYDDIHDAHRLLDTATLEAGRAHLAALDDERLSVDRFLDGLREAVAARA